MSEAESGESLHERRRREIVATVPRSYAPSLHLGIPTGIGLGIMIDAAMGLHSVGPAEWLTIPITLLGGLALEWRAHKSLLHKRMPPLHLLYERHELAHHVIYTDEAMPMRSRRELFLILMPAYAIVLVFGMVVPLAWGVSRLVSENAARLLVMTSMFFFLSYEWMHMAYHLPPTTRIGRNRIVSVLRELHRRHHDPRLMKKWNFNVTVPVFDWVHGTMWSEERARSRETRRGRRAAAAK